MQNKFPGKCYCGVWVEAGEGSIFRNDAQKWEVRCSEHVGAKVPETVAASKPHVPQPRQEALPLTAAGMYAQAKVNRTSGDYVLLSGHKASPYQAAIFEHMDFGTGSRIIQAVAGASKTTSMKEGLRYIDERLFVQMLAFNVDAARQLKEATAEIEATGRNCSRVRAGTFHSLGLGAVRKFLNLPDAQFTIDEQKCRKIFRDTLHTETEEGRILYNMYGSFVNQLVGHAKGQGIGCLKADVPESWWHIISHHGMSLDSDEADMYTALEYARDLLQRSNAAAKNGNIDYNDMLYLPILWKLKLWQNDVVIADECFLPDTPILISLSGEQKTIEQLYTEAHSSNFCADIVTWNAEKGTHISKIIGVKRVPVGKPFVRIKTRQIGFAKNGTRLSPTSELVRFGERILVCTEDHPIWTKDGWVPAGKLTTGTIVKHETLAKRDPGYQDRYKHSIQGRAILRETADPNRFGIPKGPCGFKSRGGNGRGPSKRETLLAERLGYGWELGYIVPTHATRENFVSGRGWHGKGASYSFKGNVPSHFKLDLADPINKIAIEIDGGSHKVEYVQDRDLRKEKWLTENGWTVIRITNEEVVSLSDELLEERISSCPVDAEVILVEPWANRKHEYVYDLTVAETHCYFAHGLLVHNCQDTNPVRRALLHLALKPGGRLYAVGDTKQAIYGFSGADNDAMQLIKEEFNCVEMPLTVSYRCARKIVERAQTWVPYIEASDFAKEGIVDDDVPLHLALASLTDRDAILCRQTAPLVEVAYKLISIGRPCRIAGKEIGEGLVNLIEQQKAKGIDRLIEKLGTWRDREMAKFIAKGEETRAEAVADRVECILVITKSLLETERTIPALIRKIEGMFSDGEDRRCVLTLSTCHKAKGREWDAVAILRPELMPSKAARREWMMEQEINLQYVACTRAKQHLIYCRYNDMDIEKRTA